MTSVNASKLCILEDDEDECKFEVRVLRSNIIFYPQSFINIVMQERAVDKYWKRLYRECIREIKKLNLGGRLDPPLKPSTLKILEDRRHLQKTIKYSQVSWNTKFQARGPPIAYWKCAFEHVCEEIRHRPPFICGIRISR